MPERVLRVALTGGIATGKSYVTHRLHEAGLATIDADRLAREAVAPGTPGLRPIVDRFGREMLSEAGALDRARLATTIFGDEAARRDLEGIVHPEVYRRITHWQAQLIRTGYRGPLVADIPLLFETGRQDDFEVVVVVACDPARQRERLMARDRLSAHDADQRLAAQWPIDRKAQAADFVVRTDGTFADTDVQVTQLVRQLHRRAARHP